jgi:hypothetical protein
MLPNGNDTLHATSSVNHMDKICCMTDMVFLRYLSEGIMQYGTLTVEFEYSSSLCSINYLDVQYSDPQMRKHVEGNPNGISTDCSSPNIAKISSASIGIVSWNKKQRYIFLWSCIVL